LLYSIVFIAIAVLMGFTSHLHNNKIVNGLEISVSDYDSLKFINNEVVKRLLSVKYDSILFKENNDIDVSLIEKEVKTLSSVEKVDVSIDVIGKITINIKQKKPVGRIVTAKYNCYIDVHGNKMPLSQLYSANVPLIDGKVNDENIDEIFGLLIYIRNNEVLKEQIVSIRVDKNNEYEFRTRKGNQVIEFGKAENIKAKFEKLLIYYRNTVSDFGWNRYKKINLEFANQIVCTKR